MKELTFKLTVDETNLILNGLGNLPYSQTYSLISKIHEQAAIQLEEQEGAAGLQTPQEATAGKEA